MGSFRRRFLALLGTAGGVSLAGCTTQERRNQEQSTATATETETPTDTNTSTDTRTDTRTDSPTDNPTASRSETPTTSSTERPTESATESPTDSPTDSPTASSTASPTSGSRRLTNHTFEIQNKECGSGKNQATVTRDGNQVVVDGIIDGRNTCYTAELKRAEYNSDTDDLTVAIRSYEDDGGGSCGQCIVDIDYRATFEFNSGTPDDVTVRHNGEHVTSE